MFRVTEKYWQQKRRIQKRERNSIAVSPSAERLFPSSEGKQRCISHFISSKKESWTYDKILTPCLNCIDNLQICVDEVICFY